MTKTLVPPTRPAAPPFPGWVPEPARAYLEHTEAGSALRELARARDCHASTVLRHVRSLENRRDDILVDEALRNLGAAIATRPERAGAGLRPAPGSGKARVAQDDEVARESRRILRRLAETGAFLIVAQALQKAAVMRDVPGGAPVRTAALERPVAQAFALKDWITCYRRGKVARYRITAAGRAALKRMIAEDDAARRPHGMAEAPSPFLEQHREWEKPATGPTPGRRLRYNLAESPVTVLGRRRDRAGKPFLVPELVAASERLREDFEMARMGPNITQNWDRFLTGPQGGSGGGAGPAEGPRAARDRVARALEALGPGLGDIALRCCCFLEGLETAEKRLGWSARSGKIVLRIALQRLKLHYETTYGAVHPPIG